MSESESETAGGAGSPPQEPPSSPGGGAGGDGNFTEEDFRAALAKAETEVTAADDAPEKDNPPGEEGKGKSSDPLASLPVSVREKVRAELREQVSGELRESIRKEVIERLGDISPEFAALNRKKKKHHERLEKIARERESLEAAKREFDAVLEQAKTNPMEALRVLGWDEDRFVEHQIARGKKTPEEIATEREREREARVTRLEEERRLEREATEKAQAETRVRDTQQRLLGEIAALPKDRFPLLNRQPAMEVQSAAWRVMTQYYNESRGKVLDAQTIAEYLESRLEAQRSRLLGDAPETRPQDGAPAQGGPAKAGQPGQNGNGAGSRTLSASRAAERSVTPEDGDVDDDELMRRAKQAYLSALG